jgi:O-antigen/teichoic acid export membrane protein
MFKNGLYNLAGAVIRLLLSLLSVPILLSVLGSEQYGLYAIIMSIVTFSTLPEWSVSLLLTVYISKTIAVHGQSSSILKLALLIVAILSVVTGMFLWYASPYLVQFFDKLSVELRR